MRHLSHLATFSSITNMHTKNLAIVWAPNLLRWLSKYHSTCMARCKVLHLQSKISVSFECLCDSKVEHVSVVQSCELGCAVLWLCSRSRQIESACFSGTAAFMEVRIQSVVVEFILNNTEALFSPKLNAIIRESTGRSKTDNLTWGIIFKVILYASLTLALAPFQVTAPYPGRSPCWSAHQLQS